LELFKLLGTIAVNNSDANKAIDETGRKTEKLATKMKNAGEKVSSFGSKVSAVGGKLTKGITVPAAAAGTAVMAFATKSASTADNIDKMSQKIGISKKAYQEFDFICSQSGTSVDTLQMGMKSLTSAMDGAASGTKANVAQFKKLGVQVTDSSGKLRSQEDVMMETLAALQGMENQTEKARLATELFGRSGSELMPLLNGEAGSIEEMKNQAHELGLVMSDEAIKAGVNYTDKMDQLKRSFSAVATKVGTELLPYLTKLGDYIIKNGVPAFEKFMKKIQSVVDWFTNLDKGTKKIIITLAALAVGIGPVLTVAGKLITGIGSVISVGSKVISVAGKIGTAIVGLNPTILIIIATIGALVAVGVTLYKNWDKIKDAAGKLKDSLSEKWDAIKSKTTETWNKVKETMSNSMEKAKSYVSGKLDAIKKKYEENGGGLKGIAAATMEAVKQYYSVGYDAINKLTGGKLESIRKAFDEKMNAAKNIVKSAIDKIKGLFNFTWSLPKIKLPHFSISPSGWKIGDLLKGEIPKLGIEWYAKAMNNPMLLEKPTAFGINASGQIMAGGESGSEVVSGTDTLMNMISNAVASQNIGIIEAINRLLDFLQMYIPELANMQLVMDSGALVGEIAPAMDKQLGSILKMKGRGV
jgi:hypothetical protein